MAGNNLEKKSDLNSDVLRINVLVAIDAAYRTWLQLSLNPSAKYEAINPPLSFKTSIGENWHSVLTHRKPVSRTNRLWWDKAFNSSCQSWEVTWSWKLSPHPSISLWRAFTEVSKHLLPIAPFWPEWTCFTDGIFFTGLSSKASWSLSSPLIKSPSNPFWILSSRRLPAPTKT